MSGTNEGRHPLALEYIAACHMLVKLASDSPECDKAIEELDAMWLRMTAAEREDAERG